MIGYILYESIEIAFYISKLTYNGIKNTYNWYYNINEETYDNTIKMIELEKNLIIITNKYNELEKKFDAQNNILNNSQILLANKN